MQSTYLDANRLRFISQIICYSSPNLRDQRVDFLRRQLAGILRHSSLAVADYVAQFVARCLAGLIGDQRWTSEVAPLCGLPVTLRAVFLKNRIRRQSRGGRTLR